MLFILPDDEGRIRQANKVNTDVHAYEERLKETNERYFKFKHHSLISDERWMIVNDSEHPLRRRPRMAVHVDKHVIKAGGVDCAVITGAPKETEFTIISVGEHIQSGVLPDGELELGIPCPITYDVTLRKWPWQDFKFQIQAV